MLFSWVFVLWFEVGWYDTSLGCVDSCWWLIAVRLLRGGCCVLIWLAACICLVDCCLVVFVRLLVLLIVLVLYTCMHIALRDVGVSLVCCLVICVCL